MYTDMDQLAEELRRPRGYISDPRHHARGAFVRPAHLERGEDGGGGGGIAYCSIGALNAFNISSEARSAFHGFPTEPGLILINDFLGRRAALAMFRLAEWRIKRRPFTIATIETVKAAPIVVSRSTMVSAAAPTPAPIMVVEPLDATPAMPEPEEQDTFLVPVG